MPLTQQEVNDLRVRVLNKQPLTLDEMREVVAYVRQDRMTAAPTATKKGKKGSSSESIPNAQDFLDALL